MDKLYGEYFINFICVIFISLCMISYHHFDGLFIPDIPVKGFIAQ